MTKPLDSLKQPNPSEKTAPRDDWLDSELSRLEDYGLFSVLCDKFNLQYDRSIFVSFVSLWFVPPPR